MVVGVDKHGGPIMYDYKDRINATVFPGLQVNCSVAISHCESLYRVDLIIISLLVWRWL